MIESQNVTESDHAGQGILLTGATGFIGAHLLRRLLESTTTRIHCLARGATAAAVAGRLQTTQSRYRLGLLDPGRIVAVPGDLAMPALGLTTDRFGELARQVSTVVHAGAQVNLLQPSRMLEAANVVGTREILRLAEAGGATVAYLSTSEVFGPADGAVDEDTVPVGPLQPVSGYGQTKRAGELLALRARDDGRPVRVLRLDRVAGDSRTGACQPDGDDFWLLVRSALTTGVLPDTTVNLTPVDFAAEAVLALATATGGPGPVAHICHPRPIRMGDVAAALGGTGRPVRVTSVDEWAATLRQLGERPYCDPLVRLLPLIAERVLGGRPRFQAPRTTTALDRLGLRYPPVDGPLLALYVRHLRSTGFLPASDPDDQTMSIDLRG
ncbi:thioester reductase domain-containing protein [Nonomuraea sp. NPDC050643]|uniref:thioester reductase domain-containing protein n=1 Tax=Nonomuraea sp. NPDC050643 TaxID=3155660 RepID=UPI0034015F6B